MTNDWSVRAVLAKVTVWIVVFIGFYSAFVRAGVANCVQPDEHEAFTYFLVDRSDKLDDTDGLRQVFSAIDSNIKSNKADIRLVVGVITGKTAKTRILMDRVRPGDNLFESVIKLRKKKRLFFNCLKDEEAILLKQSESSKTSAILETIEYVANVFRSDNSPQKRLVIYSDMIQNSEVLSFYRGSGGAPIDDLINRIEKESLMPDWSGVEIYIAGVGGSVSDKKARRIRRFWQSYFKKAGGNLRFYGPLLTGF